MAFGVVKYQSTFHPSIFPLLILLIFSLDVVTDEKFDADHSRT